MTTCARCGADDGERPIADLRESHAELLAALGHISEWLTATDYTPETDFDAGYDAGRKYAAEHARTAIAKGDS